MPVRSLVLAVLSALLLWSCSKASDPNPPAGAAPPLGVSVVRVKRVELTPQLSSFGSISYRSKADISTTVNGTVQKIDVHEGNAVHVGEKLALLKNVQLTIREAQAKSQLQAAKASVELAKAQLVDGKRQVEAKILSLKKTQLDIAEKKLEADDLAKTLSNRKKLLKVNGVSKEQITQLKLQYASAETSYEDLLNEYAVDRIGLRNRDIVSAGYAVPSSAAQRTAILIRINTETLQAQLDSAVASVQTAESNLAAAKADVAQLTIDSPVSGIVGARLASVGEQLQAGGKLFTIMDDAQVYAVFPVPENSAMALAEGMPVSVTVPALSRTYHTRISLVSPLLDPQSGNLTVRALISNPSGRLKPGLFVRVIVQTGAPRRVILLSPTDFVSKNGGKGLVFTVRDGRVFKRSVDIRQNATSSGRVEVLRGLKEDDRVVVNPSPVLQDGEGVNVRG